MEGRAAASDLSGLRLAVLAVSNSKGEGLRPVRLYLGERVRPVGDGSFNEGHKPRVEQATRHEVNDARLLAYSS
jgi:hypothetical protein